MQSNTHLAEHVEAARPRAEHPAPLPPRGRQFLRVILHVVERKAAETGWQGVVAAVVRNAQRALEADAQARVGGLDRRDRRPQPEVGHVGGQRGHFGLRVGEPSLEDEGSVDEQVVCQPLHPLRASSVRRAEHEIFAAKVADRLELGPSL